MKKKEKRGGSIIYSRTKGLVANKKDLLRGRNFVINIKIQIYVCIRMRRNIDKRESVVERKGMCRDSRQLPRC